VDLLYAAYEAVMYAEKGSFLYAVWFLGLPLYFIAYVACLFALGWLITLPLYLIQFAFIGVCRVLVKLVNWLYPLGKAVFVKATAK